MGIFSKILGGVFGKKKQEEQEQREAAASSDSGGNPIEAVKDAVGSFIPGGDEPAVDVSEVLAEKAAAHSEDLDWKTSIVDLLKLLGIDSSYGARKELAGELGISGYEGTAEQNISMHKVVLQKLAENGGIVPAELLD